MSDPWLLAARSVIEHGPVTPGELELPVHLVQHPECAIGGKQETVYTRCCGTPVPLGRPMWACEVPGDTGLAADCCARPYVIYGDPARPSPEEVAAADELTALTEGLGLYGDGPDCG